MEIDGARLTLKGEGEVKTEEKRSVFIGYACPVKSEEEAKKIINARREKYKDATHNVWAYYINGGIHARYSDDGEPQGTAGMPTLNVLKMSGGTDICVIVTRYFGGTLLGAGGLVRAYSAAAKQALDKAGLCRMIMHTVYEIRLGYSDYQRLTVKLSSLSASEDSAEFANEVTVTAAVPCEKGEAFVSAVTELCGGKCTITEKGSEERSE